MPLGPRPIITMRSLLLILCAGALLTACAGPQVVSLDALPPYGGDVSRLFLLTSSGTPAARGADNDQPLVRPAGRLPVPDERGSGSPVALPLVDGWVVTQHPDFPTGTSSTLTITQNQTGATDYMRMHASRFEDDLVSTAIKATFTGARARVRDAYVLNTRFFGLQLSDERFVLFDRQSGHFLNTSVDMHGVEDAVYVDRKGQPYLCRQPDGKSPAPPRTLVLPDTDLRAPLSPREVFPVADSKGVDPRR